LDKESDIKIFEYSSGSRLTEGREINRHDFTAELSNPNSVRLFLVEGLSNKNISDFGQHLGVEKKFFHHHFLDCLPHDRLRSAPDGCFFAKWSRRVLQEHAQWSIETKIASGQPYDVDILSDPHHIGLDHNRYHKFPNIHRQYDLLEPQLDFIETPLLNPKKLLRHAAKECISYCYKPVTNGYMGNIRLVSRNSRTEFLDADINLS